MTVLDRIRGWFEPHQPLQPGIYHYQTPPDAAVQYRLHLRVEKDRHGVLVINAARVLHLNQTATEHAKLLIEHNQADDAARVIARRYDVPFETARADFEQLRDTVTA
ncbi:MAG TPA: PqqD family protein, partial [Anaerolineae bacterium]|nr:PqqD family protein [Anaerolineae bacterium]